MSEIDPNPDAETMLALFGGSQIDLLKSTLAVLGVKYTYEDLGGSRRSYIEIDDGNREDGDITFWFLDGKFDYVGSWQLP